ncbi:hypothetical protein BX600DRAFT_161216 [Xylariales sp. PMI_506]|nr:hypothetical protein BX600DRAFT_161216 [Xylariales sp. PMI_506]
MHTPTGGVACRSRYPDTSQVVAAGVMCPAPGMCALAAGLTMSLQFEHPNPENTPLLWMTAAMRAIPAFGTHSPTLLMHAPQAWQAFGSLVKSSTDTGLGKPCCPPVICTAGTNSPVGICRCSSVESLPLTLHLHTFPGRCLPFSKRYLIAHPMPEEAYRLPISMHWEICKPKMHSLGDHRSI